MGRLLAPWYTYVLHVDPAIANFYKRLVRDSARLDVDRVTCAAAAVVGYLRATVGPFASVHARRNEFQFVETNRALGAAGPRRSGVSPRPFPFDSPSPRVGLADAVNRGAAAGQALYVATDEKDGSFFDPLRATRRVALLSDVAAAGPDAVRRPIAALNGNELGFVDALVASQGETFTGSWFSTFTSFINRLRGFGGFDDATSYFTAPDRWAAFQGYESFRTPLYMREWQEAWRDIDTDAAAAPRDGERVFGDFRAISKTGYPAAS